MALITTVNCITRVPQAAANVDILDEIIEEAEGIAGGYCHRTLASTSYTEYHNPSYGQTEVCLRNYPVTGTTTVYTAANTTSPTTLTADTDYTIDTDRGIISLLGGTYPDGPRNLKVTYTAGYSTATLPANLRRALYQLVGWLLETAGTVGAQTESMDGYSVTPEKIINGVPESIAAMLDEYRKVVV